MTLALTPFSDGIFCIAPPKRVSNNQLKDLSSQKVKDFNMKVTKTLELNKNYLPMEKRVKIHTLY